MLLIFLQNNHIKFVGNYLPLFFKQTNKKVTTQLHFPSIAFILQFKFPFLNESVIGP
jgi:hypothetical protein